MPKLFSNLSRSCLVATCSATVCVYAAKPANYEGREPNARWRVEALKRIETTRKGDFTLTLRYASGAPLANENVRVELWRHDFQFGANVPASFLATDHSADAKRYRDIVDQLFSGIVFGNELNHDGWFGRQKSGRQTSTIEGMKWAKEQYLPLRGHNLFLVAVNDHSRPFLSLKPDELRKSVFDSMRQRIAFAEGYVDEWDALNHPVGWPAANMLPKAGGFENIDLEAIKEADRLTKVRLCLNEDQLFREGGQQQVGMLALIKRLKKEGARVDVVGNQFHNHATFLAPPEAQIAIMQKFLGLVPRFVITEYDIDVEGNDQLSADYTRDSLIAAFSQPGCTGFYFWTLWEGRKRTDATPERLASMSLWDKDWKPKPTALVVEDLLGHQWRTKIEAKTDGKGSVTFRGFQGRYRVLMDGKTKADAVLTGTKAEAIVEMTKD